MDAVTRQHRLGKAPTCLVLGDTAGNPQTAFLVTRVCITTGWMDNHERNLGFGVKQGWWRYLSKQPIGGEGGT